MSWSDLEDISDVWKCWVEDGDGWFFVLYGEIFVCV